MILAMHAQFKTMEYKGAQQLVSSVKNQQYGSAELSEYRFFINTLMTSNLNVVIQKEL